MRGRSRITFSKKQKRLLRDLADEEEDQDLLTRAKWLTAAASQHTSLGNKLISIARYMKSKTSEPHRTAEVRLLCHKTAIAYKDLATKHGKRKQLTQSQKDNIKRCWQSKPGRKAKVPELCEKQANIRIE